MNLQIFKSHHHQPPPETFQNSHGTPGASAGASLGSPPSPRRGVPSWAPRPVIVVAPGAAGGAAGGSDGEAGAGAGGEGRGAAGAAGAGEHPGAALRGGAREGGLGWWEGCVVK